MSDRKITDVILELEKKVNTILQLQSNTDNNVKIILANLNSLQSRAVGHSLVTQAPKPKIQPSINLVLDHDAIQQLEESSKKNKNKQVIEPSDELQEEFIHVGKRRDLRVPGNSGSGKAVVSQQINFHDGKAVFLANVSITDSNGKTIKQTRTNATGRWIAPLDPGQYTVRIVKRQEANKAPLQLKYNIEVPGSGGNIELASQEI